MSITIKKIRKNRDETWLGADNQKPLTHRFLRRISAYISYFFINYTNITANQVSMLILITGLIGCFFIGIGGYWYMLLGISIFQIAFLLDMTDGSVARARGKSTYYGVWFDTVTHYIHRVTLILGLGFGIYHMTGSIIYLYLGMTASFFLTLDNLNKLKVYEICVNHKRLNILEETREDYKEQGEGSGNKFFLFLTIMSRPNEPFTFLFFSILLGVPYLYLFWIFIVSILYYFRNVLQSYNKLKDIEFIYHK